MVHACFPNFNKREVKIETFSGPMLLNSYWSGGTRDYYAFLNLSTLKSVGVPENGSAFVTPNGIQCNSLPEGLALVRFTQGGYSAATIFLRPENIAPMLERRAELTRAEQIVLVATRCYKASYAGISDYRAKEIQRDDLLSMAEIQDARASLQGKGLLNKRNALTTAGKNACPKGDLYQFRVK